MTTLFEAIELYINALSKDGKSINTIKSYRADLNNFVTWIEAQDSKGEGATGGTGVQSAREKDIEKYVQFLKTSGGAPATANRRIVSLRKFFEYLAATNVIQSSPATKQKVKAVQRQNTVKWLDRSEVNRILTATETQSNAGMTKKIRDKAIIMTLVNCGLRVSELCDLELNDLDWANGMLTVRSGKGDEFGKFRLVPFGKSTQHAVKEYLGVRGSDSKSVFISERQSKMTERAVQFVAQKLSKESGVDFTVHHLRHTFGKQVADQTNGRLEAVAQLLGHESIETTRIYVTSSMKELAKAVEAIEFE